MSHWRKILIAVDTDETSLQAVRYVSDIAPLIDEVQICLLHVYPEPPPDFYVQGGNLDDYKETRMMRAKALITKASALLLAAGLNQEQVSSRICMNQNRTISEEVLAVRAEGGFGTVVTGKRGVSKAEEFLFGSISNSLARHSKDFTSWIVG